MSMPEAPVRERQTQTAEPETQQPRLWHVVLLNDEEHTDIYVVQMMKQLFGHPVERGAEIAKRVDTDGRAICMTTHKELAELKQEQIHAFGKDALVASCAGSMSSVIEPAEYGEDDSLPPRDV
jgi:ATP-dependent Clp protease adaptor protein ClpS